MGSAQHASRAARRIPSVLATGRERRPRRGACDQSVAGWEKRGRIPLLADKHLRLLWTEKHDGNEPIVRAMERLNEVERLVHQKIVARETPRRGWTTKSEDLEEGWAADSGSSLWRRRRVAQHCLHFQELAERMVAPLAAVA